MTKTLRKAATSVTGGSALYAITAILLVVPSDSLLAKNRDVHAQAAVVVRVDNEAEVPADQLRLAEERAADIFRQIGTRVTWVEKEEAIAAHFRVPYTVVLMLANPRPDDQESRNLVDGVLGQAVPVTHRAHVYYDRIIEMGFVFRRPFVGILGDVIAHELGHLILREHGHTGTGIMRQDVSYSWAIETFNGDQGRRLRAQLPQAP